MRITVEFIGGCLDGNRIAGNTVCCGDMEQVDRAAVYYHLTDGGEPGQQFWVISDSARFVLSQQVGDFRTHDSLICRRHYYEVVQRIERIDDVLFRARFVVTVQPAELAKN